MNIKGLRREAKRNKRRWSMKVVGKSIFLIDKLGRERNLKKAGKL
jgi:hypothetical protein